MAKWQRGGLQNRYAGVRFPSAPPYWFCAQGASPSEAGEYLGRRFPLEPPFTSPHRANSVRTVLPYTLGARDRVNNSLAQLSTLDTVFRVWEHEHWLVRRSRGIIRTLRGTFVFSSARTPVCPMIVSSFFSKGIPEGELRRVEQTGGSCGRKNGFCFLLNSQIVR